LAEPHRHREVEAAAQSEQMDRMNSAVTAAIAVLVGAAGLVPVAQAEPPPLLLGVA
jgi:anti-sigma-K factor RskA